MKIELKTFDGRTFAAHPPYEGAECVEVQGRWCACQGKEGPGPLRVAGAKGTVIETEDQTTATAICFGCRGLLGELVVTLDTLFGRTEDIAVRHGRPRVY